MANAVIDSDGSIECSTGSESYDNEADEASDIELEDNVAGTIMDLPSSPDFGECIVWSVITAGTSTGCNPAIIPVWLAGISGVEWADNYANSDDDTGICALGGAITVDDAGTEIEIE